MNALLSLNNITWQTGALLLQDVGDVAKKFRKTKRSVITTEMLGSTKCSIQNNSIENNHIPKDPRQAKRVSIALPVNLNNCKCITYDMSETGVFIVSESQYKRGDQIEFAISVDQLLKKQLLKCNGKVVRVAEIQGKVGFAVKIETHFLESEKNIDLNPIQ